MTSPAILNALDAAGYSARRSGELSRRESHWDTHDGVLRRQGFELVHDAAAGEWRLAGPEELIGQLGSGEAPPAEGPLAERLPAGASGRHFLPWLHAEAEGESFSAARRGERGTEIALARWTLASPLRAGATRRRSLVHIRGEAAEVNAAATVIRALARCRLVQGGLLEHGLRSLGLPVPGSPPPAALRLAGADPPPAALAKLLARQGLAIAANGPGVVADLDPEFVHDLRVATRRARAALRLARVAGHPARAALAADLAWLARACGPLRDLDIFALRVEAGIAKIGADRAAEEPLRLALRGRRAGAHAAAAKAIGSARFAALLERLRAPGLRHPRRRSQAAPAPTIADSAPALVEQALRRLMRWRHRDVATLEAADLHAIRILGKRARYALEFFAPVLPAANQPALAALIAAQDCLGAHQDAVVSAFRLEQLARELLDAGAGAQSLLLIGGLLRGERAAQRRERRRFASRADQLWKRVGVLRRLLRPRPTPT